MTRFEVRALVGAGVQVSLVSDWAVVGCAAIAIDGESRERSLVRATTAASRRGTSDYPLWRMPPAMKCACSSLWPSCEPTSAKLGEPDNWTTEGAVA